MTNRGPRLVCMFLTVAVVSMGCAEERTLCDPGVSQPCRCGEEWGQTYCDDEGGSWGVCLCPDDEGSTPVGDVAPADDVIDPEMVPPDLPCSIDCTGKECGPDGCGGICGACGVGSACVEGSCVTGVGLGDPCESTEDCLEGLCIPLGGGEFVCADLCSTDQDCPGGYSCKLVGLPTGETAFVCLEDACEPDCATKQCGDDGCGGSCGVCSIDAECVEGVCEQPFELDCQGVDNPLPFDCPEGLTYEGCCTGGVIVWCDGGELFCVDCGETNSTCGWSPQNGYYDCGGEGEDPSGLFPLSCSLVSCSPDCAGKECGDDGCGGSCGTCGDTESCAGGSCVGPPEPLGGCTSDDDCEDGFCFPVAGGTSFCASMCVDDCPAPLECTFVVSEGGYGLYACMPPSCQVPHTFDGPTAVANWVTMASEGNPSTGFNLDGDTSTCAPESSCSMGVDNSAGAFVDVMATYVDINQEVGSAISSGELVYLVEPTGWAPGAVPYEVQLFEGIVDETTGCTPSTESCAFWVGAASFDQGLCATYVLRDCTWSAEDIVCGGPGYVAPAPFFPFFLETFSGLAGANGATPLLLYDAIIRLDVGSVDGVVSFQTGVLGGIFSASEIQAAITGLSSCADPACPGAACDINTCTIETGGMSLPLSVIINLMKTALTVDMDLNGDGMLVWEDDGFSAGYVLSFTPASIAGVVE